MYGNEYSKQSRSQLGLSSLGLQGVPWHSQILADQLTLAQQREADYAHQIILAPPDFQTFRRPWSVQWGPHAFSPAVTKAFKKVTR